MAVGESVITMSSIANNAYLTIQPSAGTEYMISNIHSNGSIEIYYSDGTNRILFEKIITSPYATALQKLFTNNTYYIQVKNVSGSTNYIGYSGIQVK